MCSTKRPLTRQERSQAEGFEILRQEADGTSRLTLSSKRSASELFTVNSNGSAVAFWLRANSRSGELRRRPLVRQPLKPQTHPRIGSRSIVSIFGRITLRTEVRASSESDCISKPAK
jgi:hypothetical protein